MGAIKYTKAILDNCTEAIFQIVLKQFWKIVDTFCYW